MASSTARCKICGETRSVNSPDAPPEIAAEGVMEAIQEHIFRHHCDDDLNLVEGDYAGVGSAWEYV